jgi:filamentous hemagglutinin family protein
VTRQTNKAIAAGAGFGLLLLAAIGAQAQTNLGLVVLDGSITGDVAQPPGGVVPATIDANYLIVEGYGHKEGSNLFHSFQQFSVGEGENAHFTTEGGVDIIFARVPGEGLPEIELTSIILGPVESDASLFLLNPYGVFFGEGASVDVNGSFYVSSADVLNFESGGASFLTTEATTPVSFASTPPASFGFLVDEPALIEFASEELCDSPCVPSGETFSVVGGDILIDGLDESDRTINVTGGTIQLVSVARAGVTVPLDATTLDLSAYSADSFGEVRLQNRAVLTVPSDGSSATAGTGKIVIRGGQFVLAGSDLEAVAGSDSIDGEATGIDVEVTGSIELTDYEGNLSEVVSFSRDGRSGDIRFSGESFTMDGGTRILNLARDVPDGADVFIDANTIELTGTGAPGGRQTQIVARPRGTAGTTSGDIHLSGRAAGTEDRAESITISEYAQIAIQSEDDVAGGNIGIATDLLEIKTSGEVLAITQENGTSGSVRIDAGEATLADGGRIQSLTEGQNKGADIIFTGESLTLTRGGEISTQVTDTFATGDGGNIDITVPDVLVTESGLILSTNLGEGMGGSIDITADTALSVSNEGQIVARTGPNPPAAAVAPLEAPIPAPPASPAPRGGGDVTIHTGRLTVAGREGAPSVTQISTITRAEGLDGTDEGRGGNLTVHAEQIDLVDGGQLRVTTLDSAPAGALHVVAHGTPGGPGGEDAPGLISIRGVVDRFDPGDPGTPIPTPSGIFATSGEGTGSSATGEGGTALIEADIIELHDGAEIQSSTFGAGDANTLQLIATDRITVSGASGESSRIVAQGAVGTGGDLDIQTGLLELIDGGEVSVSALDTGNSGNMTVNADRIVVQGANSETSSGIFAKSNRGQIADGDAGSIHLITTDLVVTDEGQVAVTTGGGGDAGVLLVEATNIEVLDGGSIAAESESDLAGAGAAGSIDLRASQKLLVSNAEISTQTRRGEGGSITLAAEQITVDRQGVVSAATDGTGNAGQIVFQNVDDVLITGASEVTSKSTAADNGGRAGSIEIAARDSDHIDQGSQVTTTTEDANGGGISIQAGELVYLLDAVVKSDIKVKTGQPDTGAGDIFIPFAAGAPNAGPPPDFVVINRSTVSANAVGPAANGGDITITGTEVLISADSVIEATADDPTGVSGNIQISAPDSDVVSQVTPLATAFIDASDRLLPPCIARTERTGSFIDQNRAATPPSPDSPLSAGLGTAGGAGEPSPSDSVECSVFEEKI